jgi:SPP1 family predicted phage head-tail adaptor
MENLSKILPSIGAMDEEITIQSYTESRNASGEQVLTWSTYVTTLARVKWPDAGMKETYSADQQTAFRKIVFEIRYDPNLDMGQKRRLLYRQIEICDIIGVGTLGRDRFTVLTCQMKEETVDYLTDDDGNPLTDDSGNILTPN